MITIYDNRLFAELEKKPEWNTLFDDDFYPKNPNIPILAGGLDHISKTNKYFTFHDIGCNGRDNSFRIGREVFSSKIKNRGLSPHPKEEKMEKFNDQFIPVVLEEDDWIIKTAGYQQSCYHDKKARNGFYVVSGRKPDGVDYVHPNIYSHDMTVEEIRKIYPEATLGDFFSEEIQDWIAMSYRLGLNPLPSLRSKFPEYNFCFQENLTNKPDVPLPEEGAVILVDRQGNMASQPDEPQPVYEVEADDPEGMPEMAIPY